jgi:hypothetical protein
MPTNSKIEKYFGKCPRCESPSKMIDWYREEQSGQTEYETEIWYCEKRKCIVCGHVFEVGMLEALSISYKSQSERSQSE